MDRFLYLTCVLTLSAVALPAQVIPITANVQTTGMVGLADAQAARLNLLNPGVQPPATGAACSAVAAFVDAAGNTVKSATVSVLPGRSVALEVRSDTDLKVAAGDRREIRATVAVPGIVPLASPAAIIAAPCTLVATLEVYDTLSGRTQAVLDHTFTVAGVPK